MNMPARQPPRRLGCGTAPGAPSPFPPSAPTDVCRCRCCCCVCVGCEEPTRLARGGTARGNGERLSGWRKNQLEKLDTNIRNGEKNTKSALLARWESWRGDFMRKTYPFKVDIIFFFFRFPPFGMRTQQHPSHRSP